MNRKYPIVILLFLSVLFGIKSFAQDTRRIEAEADPIAFLLSGYSFHLGYMINHLRFDAGAYGIRQPAFFVNNDNFNVYSSGIGIKADYFLKKNEGVFIGIQSDFLTDKISLKSTGNAVRENNITAGLRGGYRFIFSDQNQGKGGFYLVPWIALIYTSDASRITLSDQTYTQSSWSVFPTVHLGYRF